MDNSFLCGEFPLRLLRTFSGLKNPSSFGVELARMQAAKNTTNAIADKMRGLAEPIFCVQIFQKHGLLYCVLHFSVFWALARFFNHFICAA